MLEAPIPSNDEQRLAALDRSGLLRSRPDPRFDRVARLAKRLFKSNTALISLVAKDEQWFKAKDGLEAQALPRKTSFCGHAVAQSAPLIVKDTKDDPRFFDNPLVTGHPFIRFYAGYPVYFEGQVLGTLCVFADKPRAFSDEDMDTLASLASWVENEIRLSAMAHRHLDLQLQLDNARRDALTDPMTGAWTRRLLTEQLAPEINRRRHDSLVTSLMLVDVDRFKQINDEHGHDVGDAVLVEIVARLNHLLRSSDIVVRLGGDEFLVYLGGCPEAEAQHLAKRVLDGVMAEPCLLPDGTLLPLSLSIGVASSNDLDLDALTALADDALYDSKKGGRGRWSARQQQVG
ncbi:sensor domain-containing diguanylate cyclase [Gallaecimonas xiamenensis]|uniref:Diguanylate cyclase n=1 Tax=Gallaecimonas xiamenensis 3-C-1 TaxID=745411 RepID=K2JBE4_9GAMM|nr:sensor domain-containing diguanylate cyclase [Gallaecimonas xiamenensis]EKE67929.1 diguanylate cyclase [Gallaecimonas xiamenensis 3-C-1]